MVDQRGIYSRGVISDWPSSIPDLWQAMVNKESVIKLERMYRRKWDEKLKKSINVKTDNIVIIMKGENLCREISIFDSRVKLRVRPYIQSVRQCYNCYKFGHIKQFCKSNTVCINYGREAHGLCEAESCCRNCGGAHRSIFRQCSVLEKNRSINTIMAYRNVSFHKASVEEQIPVDNENGNNNRYNLNTDTEEFFIERIVEKVILALETETRVGWLDNEEEGNRLSRRSASFSEKGDKINNEQRVTMVFLNGTPSFSPWDEKAGFKPFTKHWLWSTIRPLGSELWTIKVIDELLLALPRNNDVDVVVLCSLRGA
ncbi:Nucleic-acid-binding protein from mobile element jockey [Trachymyrmex cornetzi]|uniref:Nucleic-acid-binding protein from mobile element jockey n=1 Tax=Trachymyrmex cornetzi TaxID=471704 RepID=A0A151JRC6_9HYME|nr:Nucleic-acid-binding protein from mobile element jockey [Trachymyrmex cornetzi]